MNLAALLAILAGQMSTVPYHGELAYAVAQVHEAQAVADQTNSLYRRGVVARHDLEKAQTALQNAQGQLTAMLRSQHADNASRTPLPPTAAPTPTPAVVFAAPAPASASPPAAADPLAEVQQTLAQARQRLQSADVQVQQLLTAAEQAAVETAAGQQGNPAYVSAAQRFLGVPYHWGGTTSRGIDCSGLVLRILQIHGIRAPHSAAEIFRMGIAVDRKDLQPGDLVFFRNTYKPGISHVGVYLRDGKIIHASGIGRGVTISRLDDPFLTAHYAGARRIGSP